MIIIRIIYNKSLFPFRYTDILTQLVIRGVKLTVCASAANVNGVRDLEALQKNRWTISFFGVHGSDVSARLVCVKAKLARRFI